MLMDSLKKVGKEVARAWENLSEGWREMMSRSGSALTQFKPPEDEAQAVSALNWALLAGEVQETGREIIVRVEMPGLEKDDIQLAVIGNTLYLYGEKRCEREEEVGEYYLMERAFGSFERAIPLPKNVDGERAQAAYERGVLSVRFPKLFSDQSRRIPIG